MEIKLDYAIDTAARCTRYRVETYFFVPRSLGLTPHSYSRDQFYSDVQAYIRFKTPGVSLASLIDPEQQSSPLYRAQQLMARAGGAADPPRDSMSHEMRLLGCLVRTNLRDGTADIRRKIARLDDPHAHEILTDDVRQATCRLVDDVARTLDAFRTLRPDFLEAKRPRWLREMFEYVDEYLSISAEAYLTAILGQLDDDPELRRALPESRRRLARLVTAEQQHRRSAGYVSVLDPQGGNDSYIHRKSALKKFMSSVLFLKIHKAKEGRGATNVVAGIAAAVAMLFSTVAAIWSQGVYGLNSFPFVIAVVTAYVFKDRIKEWLRAYFSGRLSRLLHDYSVYIHDPVAQTAVGRCRESFTYLDDAQLPPEILHLRHADSTSVLEPESKPEVVMKYVKDVTLRGRTIARLHGRLGDVNDIIRFNISSFLARMDEPLQSVKSYDAALDRITTVDCPKAYHVNLVMVLQARGQHPIIERFRIILDKYGIKELQDVELPHAALTSSSRRASSSGSRPAPPLVPTFQAAESIRGSLSFGRSEPAAGVSATDVVAH